MVCEALKYNPRHGKTNRRAGKRKVVKSKQNPQTTKERREAQGMSPDCWCDEPGAGRPPPGEL